ncbi:MULTISPECIES: DUF4113 domain-containing protein [Providencia]|nr:MULTISPECIES: DUF4113 domain-containing protein [Providencia]MDK7743336.1 DUF4113 domain-containing protein [Providencia rettgeri]MDK7756178.1 DUF4113 domain-containing protein [Providencia rettgeri]
MCNDCLLVRVVNSVYKMKREMLSAYTTNVDELPVVKS